MVSSRLFRCDFGREVFLGDGLRLSSQFGRQFRRWPRLNHYGAVRRRCFRFLLNLRRRLSHRSNFYGRSFSNRGRGQCRLGHLGRFREAIFILRLEGSKNQLGQQLKAADVTVVEAERLSRECFQQSDHATASAQWHSDHRPCAQLTACVEVYAIIGLCIIAPDNLRRAETCSREGRIALDARAHIRLDDARRSPQNNFVVLRQSDSQSVRAGDGNGSFRDQLQHFVQNELLLRLKLVGARDCLESTVPRG